MTEEENALLTRVEGHAPMGQLMRRFWTPAALSEEVERPGGPPRRIRLMGENLVLFRGRNGEAGLLGEHCPHRRASLALGRVGDCSLTCLYHGWEVNSEGRVLDMPSEPGASGMKEKVRHLAYPVRESGGMIWAYMGPPEEMPPFQPPSWAIDASNDVVIAKMHEEANWAQAIEGTIDSAHTSSLHSSSVRSDPNAKRSTDLGGTGEFIVTRPSADKSPKIRVQYTGYGFRAAAIRKPLVHADKLDYVRVSVYVAPYTTLIPPQDTFRGAHIFVPIDDYNCMFYFVMWSNSIKFDKEKWRRENFAQIGVDLDDNFKKIKRSKANNYLQDRDAMEAGDFTGIAGIPNQDHAMQESMGPIVDRTKENLGASDIAIGRFRQLMVHAAREFAAGKMIFDPAGREVSISNISSFEGLVEKQCQWRDLAVTPEETATFRETLFSHG